MYVVIITEPNKRRTVYGPFAMRTDAKAFAQTKSDTQKEDGPGYRYSVDEVQTPDW